MYEYKFVKDELVLTFSSKKEPVYDYHKIIEENAKEGWRLVQIFSPAIGTGFGGNVNYFELIFEREVKQNADE